MTISGPALAAAAAAAGRRAAAARDLADAGWSLEHGRTWTLVPPPVAAGPLPGAAGLAASQDAFTGGRLVADLGDLQIAVRPAGGALVSEPAGGDPDAAGNVPAVRESVAGNAGQALALSAGWSGQLTVVPAAPLADADPSVSWLVLPSPADVAALIQVSSFWRVARTLGAEERPAVVVCVDSGPPGTGPLYDAPGLLVVALADVAADPDGHAQRIAAHQVPPDAPEGALVAPDDGRIPGLRADLERRAAGRALASLANTREYDDTAGTAALIYQGVRQRRLDLPPHGWDADPAEALHLLAWTREQDAQDRLLAVQQTLARHTPAELAAPGGLAGVRASADTVQRVLRSDAVGTALTLVQDSRKAAVDAARSSSEAALAAARSVAERILAGLAATGAVVVAHAATRLPEDTARQLVAAVAGYLLFLALWALLVEGPAVTAPLRAFKKDLPTTAALLGETQRNEILGLRSLRLAWWRARTVRLVGPAVYAAAALVVAGLSLEPFSDALRLPLLIPE